MTLLRRCFAAFLLSLLSYMAVQAAKELSRLQTQEWHASIKP